MVRDVLHEAIHRTRMRIDHNVHELTPEEQAEIRRSTWYMYTYGVGLIFLENGSTWDPTNSAAAKDYLDNTLKIREKK
jgi:hypothetical protein